MSGFLYSLLAGQVACHAGVISLSGADGPMWAYEASPYWNAGTANWYSSGSDQYFPGHYDREWTWYWRDGLSGEEVALMKQQAKLKHNPQGGIPLEDKCNGGKPTDDPNKSIPNPWEMPAEWTYGMWNFGGWSWAPTKKPGFCPGELVEWKHKIVADHNGVDAMIVLLDENELPAGANVKPTNDGYGYFLTNWRYLAHDNQDHPDGRTVYYNKEHQEVDTSTCRAVTMDAEWIYTMADGKPWDETLPHCYDEVYRVSYFRMPNWLEHGKTYTFQWQWYSGTGLNSAGEMLQPRFYTHEPEGAYFAQCIEVKIRSAEECGTQVPTTQAPTTQAPTTQSPTTQAPTTQAPTTQVPTTQVPTTQAPTSQVPTTQAPTTQPSSDVVPLWGKCGGKAYSGPTICESQTVCVELNEWYSQCRPSPIEELPTTQAPTTQTTTTQAPTTQAPTTQAPTTSAPTTQTPTTSAPTTQAPTTQAPTTQSSDLVPLWGQCGGKYYTGPTTCSQETYCKFGNIWYSQCVPNQRSLTIVV